MPLTKTRKKLKISVRQGVLLVLLAFLLYLILGTVLPFLHHPKVSAETRAGFEAQEFRAQGGGSGGRIRCIDDNAEALRWRIRLIESAQRELIYSTYEFHDDESGKDVLAALLAAADRGVRVRLITDGLTGAHRFRKSPYFQAVAAHENIEVRIYNPPNLLLPWKIQLRLHDKYVIADEHAYLLGGRNTFDLFLGDTSERQNIDRELLVYAPEGTPESLLQVRAYFERIWAEEASRPFAGSSSKKAAEAAQTLRSRWAALEKDAAPTDWEAETFPAGKITLLSGETAPVNKEPAVWYALSELMKEGRDIVIQTPYIILSGAMREDLAGICGSADSVRILLNAVENGANPFGCTDYLNQKEKIWATGAQVYEFSGGNSLHTKTVLIDEDLSIIGSFNLDMRSAYLDTELMLVVESPELNAQLRAQAAEQQEHSRWQEDGTYVYGPLYQHKGFTPFKRIVYALMRVLILPIRHLM